jgi:hypothetical protein
MQLTINEFDVFIFTMAIVLVIIISLILFIYSRNKIQLANISQRDAQLANMLSSVRLLEHTLSTERSKASQMMHLLSDANRLARTLEQQKEERLYLLKMGEYLLNPFSTMPRLYPIVEAIARREAPRSPIDLIRVLDGHPLMPPVFGYPLLEGAGLYQALTSHFQDHNSIYPGVVTIRQAPTLQRHGSQFERVVFSLCIRLAERSLLHKKASAVVISLEEDPAEDLFYLILQDDRQDNLPTPQAPSDLHLLEVGIRIYEEILRANLETTQQPHRSIRNYCIDLHHIRADEFFTR